MHFPQQVIVDIKFDGDKMGGKLKDCGVERVGKSRKLYYRKIRTWVLGSDNHVEERVCKIDV